MPGTTPNQVRLSPLEWKLLAPTRITTSCYSINIVHVVVEVKPFFKKSSKKIGALGAY